MLPTLILLAQNATVSEWTIAQAAVWIGGATAVAVISNQVMGAIANFKKLKGADPDADARYVTKDEHKALSNDVAEVKGQMTSLSTTFQAEFRAISRSLGRLEGAAGTEPRAR